MNTELFARLTNVDYGRRPMSGIDSVEQQKQSEEREKRAERFANSEYGKPDAMHARWGVYQIT